MRKWAFFVVAFVLFLSFFNTRHSYASENIGSKVVSIANTYLRVPYVYGGTTPAGFDCSGYTSYVFNQAGITLPRTAADQYNTGTAVSKSNLQQGDLVFFTSSGTSISHVGIYIGNNNFISATTSSGVKVASINDPYYWNSRYIGAKRVIKEEVILPKQPLAAGEFYDIKSTFWAYEAINALSTEGIITGYSDGNFLPQKAITRAEAAKMISETLALEFSQASVTNYADVPNSHWAFQYVQAATTSSIFNGYEGNIFKPNEPITRAEVATLLTRAFNLEHNGTISSFSDLNQNHWAYLNIQTLASLEIVNGYSDQSFKPTSQTTRAEFSSMLYNALNLQNQ